MKFLTLLVFLFSINCENILIIGDSISTYKNGWQDVVCRSYDANCVNLSQGGKRTDWMLKTLRDHLKNTNTTYSKMYVYGGINDMFAKVSIDTAVSNILKIVQLGKERQIEVVVIAGYDSKDVISNTWIKDKNLEKECVSRYIAFQKCLTQLNVKVVPLIPMCTSDTHDGIHPNAIGHKKISDWILSYGY